MSLIEDKANALSRAWCLRYNGAELAANAALLLLAVADLETGIGEYRGVKGLQLLDGPSHNWGQIQRRQLTSAEKDSLAKGVIPPPRNDGEFLSGDTSPDTGAYHVWLCRFPDDVAGADRMLAVIVDGEKIFDRLASMTPTDLAQSMYNARYYEGSHSRSEPGGPAKNVAAYASSIASHYTKIQSALPQGWTPNGNDDPPSSEGGAGTGAAVAVFLVVLAGALFVATRGA